MFRPSIEPAIASSIIELPWSVRCAGPLLDRGIVFAKSITRARRMIPDILARSNFGLSIMARETISQLWDLFCDRARLIRDDGLSVCTGPRVLDAG